MDKWLWAARFFKTRALASHACELGRVDCNSLTAKASREVKVGDLLRVAHEGGEVEVRVLGLSALRGPAAVAQTLYQETPESIDKRRRLAEERKAGLHFEADREGKPSKRDRRELDRLRGRA
ncbi:MAG: RNA-binding S4 domain-containing protein [Bryobacterales bacterium]|nr:RNA-binding S4 domain-containing protein [Bryobacterales bacterium]